MSANQLAELIRTKLVRSRARSSGGVPAAISFDEAPITTWEAPADAIARFAHRLGDDYVPKVKQALLEIVTLGRPERVPLEVVEDALFAIGLLQVTSALPEAARTVLEAAQWGQRGRRLQAVLVMVLKGMRGSTDASLASRLLLGHPRMHAELVFDALEVLLAAPDLPLHTSLELASGKMMNMMPPRSRRKFDRRMREFVSNHLAPHSMPDLAVAIEAICAEDRYLDSGHPLGLVLKLLLCESSSPLEKRVGSNHARLVRKNDGVAIAWPHLSDEAEQFLQSQIPLKIEADSLLHRSDWFSPQASEHGVLEEA